MIKPNNLHLELRRELHRIRKKSTDELETPYANMYSENDNIELAFFEFEDIFFENLYECMWWNLLRELSQGVFKNV
jgi:hypothetical protein